jgi:hypothetical protein
MNKQEYPPYIEVDEFTPDCFTDVTHYICKICNGVIYEATSDPEGHMFCKQCIHKFIRLVGRCPISKKELVESNLIRVDIVDKVIGKKTVYCKNKKNGCLWIGPLSDLSSHRKTGCSCEVIKCTNRDCNQYLRREELAEHGRDCEYKEIECPNYCGAILNGLNYNFHGEDCPKLPISCPQLCGALLERKQKDSHLKDCRNTIVECEFKKFGCEERIKKGELDDHIKEKLTKHLLMIGDYVYERPKPKSETRVNKILQEYSSRRNDSPVKRGNSPQAIRRIGMVKRGRGRPRKYPRPDDVVEKRPVAYMKTILDESEDEKESEDSDFKFRRESKGLMEKRNSHRRENIIEEESSSSLHEESTSEKAPTTQIKNNFQNLQKHINKMNQETGIIKRKRGRPPKNPLLKQQQLIFNTVDGNDDFDYNSRNKKFKRDDDRDNNNEVIKIDKSLIGEEVFAEDNTATLINPIKNHHKFIFGTTDVSNKDFTWGIKLNNLSDKGWIAFGLTKKGPLLNQAEKFKMVNSESFLLSSNGMSWNTNKPEQNEKIICFPKPMTGSIIDLRYFHKEQELQFMDRDSGTSVKLTEVFEQDGELVPSVIFLNNKGDSFSFV